MTSKSTPQKPHGSEKRPEPGKKNDDTEGKKTSLADYLQGVRAEWDKISWPSKMQVVSQTIVVLVMVSIMTFGIWLADRVLHDGLVCHIIPNGEERCAKH